MNYLLGASFFFFFPLCAVYTKKIKCSLLLRESQPSRGDKYERKKKNKNCGKVRRVAEQECRRAKTRDGGRVKKAFWR